MKFYYKHTSGFYSLYALLCLCFCLLIMQYFSVNVKTYVNLKESDLLYECYCINQVKKQLTEIEFDKQYITNYDNMTITFNYADDKVIINCFKYPDLVIKFDKEYQTIKEVYYP